MKAKSIMEQCEERRLCRLSNGSKVSEVIQQESIGGKRHHSVADRVSKLRFLHKVNTAKSSDDTRETSTG